MLLRCLRCLLRLRAEPDLPFKKLGVGTEARDEKLFTCQTRQATGNGRPDFSLKRKFFELGVMHDSLSTCRRPSVSWEQRFGGGKVEDLRVLAAWSSCEDTD